MNEQKVGCINCHTVQEQLIQYDFTNILGAKFVAFFCNFCFDLFKKETANATKEHKLNINTHLGKVISGQNKYKTF